MKSVFEDLGFSPEEAAALKLKADLRARVVKAAPLFAAPTADNLGRVAAQGERFVAGKNVEIQLGNASDLRREIGAAHRD